MADEKVNVSPEEKKAPEAPAPAGPGDAPGPSAERAGRADCGEKVESGGAPHRPPV